MYPAIKHPSAWIPLVVSFLALAILIIYLALYGGVHETDEGTAAHLFQILMAGQVPIIVFFVIKRLPQAPRQTLFIFTLQVFAALTAFAPVYYFHL